MRYELADRPINCRSLNGFFTRFGDGAADKLPLAGLTKRRVRAIAKHMGAPSVLVSKVPTADLESAPSS